MADEKDDEILLTVEIDEGAVEARLVELRKRSTELRTEKAALAKANKDGKISADEYAAGLTKNTLALKSNTKEIQDNERILTKNAQQHASAAGSITQMRAQVSLLYADWANLSKEERKNAEVGGVLKKQLKDLNDELKAEEGAVGDNRRSVGSYAEAIEGAISKNTNFVSTLGNIRSKLGEAQDLIKSQIQGYKDMTQGMTTTQKASVGLGMGLKAIGIGLLITAITAVIGFLSKMDAGMDKVEQATAAVSAAVEALIQTLAPVGELIVNTFVHPIDAIKSFASELVHPIDLFNKIVDGSKRLSLEAGKNMAAAARGAVEYTKSMQDVEDAQDGLIAQQASVNQQVAIALLATKDRSKTEAQRIALLDAAGKAEQKLANDQLAIQQRALKALIDFQKTKKELQDEDRKKLQEATAAVTDAETANLETQQKIQNRRSALLEQEAADRKAAADKAKQARKDAINEQVANAERELLLAKKVGKDTLAIEENLIKLRAAAELADTKGRGARALITVKAEADLLKLRADAVARNQFETLESRKQGIDAELALVTKGSLRELELRQQGLQVAAQMEQNAIVQDEKNLILRADKLKAVDAKLKADLKQNQRAFDVEQLASQQDLAKLRLQTEEDLTKNTLANQRKFQAERIDLEEQQALASLKLTEQTEEQRLVKENAIRAKATKARIDLDKQIAADKRSKVRNEIAGQLAEVEEGSRAEYKLKKKQLDEEEKDAIAAANGEADAIDRIKKEFRKKQKDLDQEFGENLFKDITNTASLATQVISNMVTIQSQALFSQLEKQQKLALESAGANADLRGRIEEQYQRKREKLEKEAARKRQRIASIENIISTAQAGTEALKLFAKNPILGAITEGLILLKAIQNQQLIDSQEFNQGGVYQSYYRSDGRGSYVRGPGTAKSDSINAKLSNGESVLTAKATTLFYNDLSAMNVAGGGRPFPGANGTEVPRLSNFAYGGVQMATDADVIASAVVRGLKGVNIAVAVTDIHSVESDLLYAQARGNS